MKNVNVVVLVGNLVRDADLKQTHGGTPVLVFTLAVNESRRNDQGEWEEYANFFECALFGVRGQKLQPYLKKGAKVCASGKLHYRAWDAQDGTRRSKIDVHVSDIELMQNTSKNGSQGLTGTNLDMSDDDIPF